MCPRLLRQFLIKLTRQQYRFKIYTFIFLATVYLFLSTKLGVKFNLLFKTNSLFNDPELEIYNTETPLCIIPQFPAIAKDHSLTSIPFQLQCGQAKPNWVRVDGGKFRVNLNVSSVFPGGITCSYIPLERFDDFSSYFGEAKTNFPDGENITSDFFYANCNTADERHFYEMLHAGIHHDEKRAIEAKKTVTNPLALNYNVVLFGIDSLSRLSFIRNLPKTYQTFTQDLDGIVFNKFNTVGDGTTVNLLSLLTGKKETELPESRRNNINGQMVDDYPWIWNEFKKAGYVTQWAEDGAKYGTFQYRLRGFKEQPTDHYMRTFFLKAEETYSKHYWGCLGSQPRHMVMLNWLREFYTVYDSSIRKFSLIFHSELSHEDNIYLAPLDRDLVQLLNEFQNGKMFQETILILFSDHGHRYAKTRSTFQGKYEERLPFLGVHIPKSLQIIQPTIIPNLRNNADTLVTLRDIHATLKDILQFEPSRQQPPSVSSSRSHSLFKPLQSDRNCHNVALDAHWCVCLRWTPLSVRNSMSLRVAHFIVNRINKITQLQSQLCSHLTVKKLQSAELYTPRSALLKFKQSRDNDARQPEFTDEMQSTQEVYRVNLLTYPGEAAFEATVYRDMVKDTLTVAVEDISRTNTFAHTTGCLLNSFPELRKFCICKTGS